MPIADEASSGFPPSRLLLREPLPRVPRGAAAKRAGAEAAAFEYDAEKTFLDLQAELLDGGYHPRPYCHFGIRDPKRRKISAAPFRDRVVHHALCQVIEPILPRRPSR